MIASKNVNAFRRWTAVFLLAAVSSSLAGCGGGAAAKHDNEFFTSGDREADQRADQRMVKDQQLKDTKSSGGGGGLLGPKPDVNRSLYERLGGDEAITGIVNDFIPRVLADPRVNWARAGVRQGGFSIHRERYVGWNATGENVQALKVHLAQFLVLATGGPAHYQGKEMQGAHAGLHITNSEFDASVGDLKASLDKIGVPVKEQKELLAIVETTRPQIVEER